MLIKFLAILFTSFTGIRTYPRLSMYVTNMSSCFQNCITFTPYLDDQYQEKMLYEQQFEKCYFFYNSFKLLAQCETLIKIDYRVDQTDVRNSKYYLAPRLNSEGKDEIYFWPIIVSDVDCKDDEYVDVNLEKIDLEVETKYDDFNEPYKEDIFHSYWTFYCKKGYRYDKDGRRIQKKEDKPYFPQFFYDVHKDRKEMIEKEKQEKIALEEKLKNAKTSLSPLQDNILNKNIQKEDSTSIDSRHISFSLEEQMVDGNGGVSGKSPNPERKVSKMIEEIIIL
jgi:hypothetical protein